MKSAKRIRNLVGLSLAVLVAAFLGWRLLRADAPPLLATSPVTIADIEDTVLASGTLEAAEMVNVGAQASGQIKSLKVKLGDRVRAGDLIAEIDATTQENEIRNARALLASLRAQRAVQVAMLRQAELEFERQKMMLAEEATSRADYELAEANLATTRAQIQALDAQIEQGEANLDTAVANLGYTRIKAPIDGTVVAIVAKEGQTVNAAQSAPTIVKIAQLDTMTVSAEISEADVIKVRPGQTVYFTVLGNPDKRYYGKLRTVEPAPQSLQSETTGAAAAGTSNNQSTAVYYNGRFEVPNPDGELRIAMTAQVHIVLAERKGALTIPSAALGPRSSDGSHTVTVLDERGRPTARTVTIGINNNVSAEVLSGLREGERVVVGEDTGEPSPEAMRRRGRLI
ncbi:MAG TPA: efflux RND transporter periplasmic adaptor subunit [Steroidobacteraceae bacterium]